MGVAKYFSKDLLAINQLIKGSEKNLEDILLSANVGVAFDSNAIVTKEGNKSLDLLVRLIARLYPNVSIIDLSKKNKAKVSELRELALSINSAITISEDVKSLNVLLVAGDSKAVPELDGVTLYLGSNNWNACFSNKSPKSFGDSDNPFGCGIASCIAVSNMFRIIFREFLPDKPLDSDFEFSTLNYSSSDLKHNPSIGKVKLNDVALVGIGAIGNGSIWSFSNMSNITGNLDVIDNELVSLSNLQRYVMFSEKDIDKIKVNLAKEAVTKNKLTITPHKKTWAEYLSERTNWNIETVAVAIDNKKDRIGIQSSLPKKIFNSYTESNLLGIARHSDFVNSACLACGYIPSQKEKNYINEVADNCNIPTMANLVKDYMNLNVPVEQFLMQSTGSMLDIIAQANKIDRDDLNQFHGKKVNEFYSEFICGGISLSLSHNESKVSNVDAPLAFQSAMAGILLAAELVVNATGLRKSAIKQQSHFYPLNPIGVNNPFNHNLVKDSSGRCLCGDEDFINQYRQKWS